MPSFESDIKPLFREKDRKVMQFVFDLWDYEDVKADAESILVRIEDGTMPCDQVWPPEDIELLRSWIQDGCQP